MDRTSVECPEAVVALRSAYQAKHIVLLAFGFVGILEIVTGFLLIGRPMLYAKLPLGATLFKLASFNVSHNYRIFCS